LIASPHSFLTPSPDPTSASFLALLPKLKTHARIYFRDVVCPDARADKVAETVAVACYADHRIMRKACIHLSPTRHLCGCGLA
jgi:hypothetical protein